MLYGKYIFPKIYGISYIKAISDVETANKTTQSQTDESIINLSDALGKVKGRFNKKEV